MYIDKIQLKGRTLDEAILRYKDELERIIIAFEKEPALLKSNIGYEFTNQSRIVNQTNRLEVKGKGTFNSVKTFIGVEFEVSNSQTFLRDKNKKWRIIKYNKNDPDLPTKLSKDKKKIQDESYVGKAKSIPKGTKVKIDEVYIQPAKSKTSNEKLKYVHIVGYGWTSVSNIVGGLKNHSVGILKSVVAESEKETHYTVAVEKTVVLKPGNRYLGYKDKRKIALNKEVTVESIFKGYYKNNKIHDLAKVKIDGKIYFTSKGNYSSKPHDKNDVNKRKIIDKGAYIRREISSYIPKNKETLFLGKFVIIGKKVKKETGTYVEIYDVAARKNNEGDVVYLKNKLLGWTNLLNLIHGFHIELKGINSTWSQVSPDDRYDRAKGRKPEGTAKFTGNDEMIKIVDSVGDIEYVSKKIWPHLKKMLDAAKKAGHNLMINTGFRHWDYQQLMIDKGYPANPVGYSLHQIGIAVDLTNKQDIKKGGTNWWMERNAYKYGFVKTYKKFKEGHHWEYRPIEIVKPLEVEINGKKYIKYTFATFSSNSSSIWDRNHVLDEIPSKK